MKKLLVFILSFGLALTLSGDFKAEEVSSFNDTNGDKFKGNIEKFNDNKSSYSTVHKSRSNKIKPSTSDYNNYKAVTKGTYKKISKKGEALTYTRTQKDGEYTYISYYKKINGKIVNYRNSVSNPEARQKISVYYLYSIPKKATATCKATQVAYGCIVTKKNDKKYRVIKTWVYEEFNADGKLIKTWQDNYSTSKANRFKDILLSMEDRYYYYNADNKIDYLYYEKRDKDDNKLASSIKLYAYHSNGKLSYVSYTKYDAKDIKIFYETKDYRSTGKLKYKDQEYFFKNGYTKRFITYNYNKNGKLIHKVDRKGNSKGYETYRDSRKYYLSGKTKERTYAYLRAKKADDVKTSYYYKYRTNGKKQVYKKANINTNGQLIKMYTYTYNKKGQKKSNKYGSAYKYITYVKKNSDKIIKVTKAKYNKKGKLGKAYKVKATKLTKVYYLGFLE